MLFLEREIPFFREYTEKVVASYRKSWPRPWPCGIVWVHWDATSVSVIRQALDPSNGHFHLDLMADGQPVRLYAFVNTTTGHLCVWTDSPAPFHSIAYYPNVDAAAQLPNSEIGGIPGQKAAEFFGFQRFPYLAPTAPVPQPPASPKDSNFALHTIVQGEWYPRVNEPAAQHPHILLTSGKRQLLRMDVALFTPRDHPESRVFAQSEAKRVSQLSPTELQRVSDEYWTTFWSRSAIELKDKELERWWYHNQYWLACCLRPGKVAPGLYGNWTSEKIGTSWHGDYHMNYNTQQVFWGVFSSNHVDQHLPYIEIVENLMPMSERHARENFKLPGAYFPHSAFPVPSQVVPYPAPPWGYELCETPWTVQSLWWHYLFTLDEALLRRVFPPLKAAAQFVAAYLQLGEDGKYHVQPSVSPENWGCTVDYRLNRDCIMDLAMIDFLLEAAVSGAEILRVDAEERQRWAHIRSHLADYPSATGPSGTVWLDVLNAPVDWVYNVPVTLAPVFPGERVGLESDPSRLAVARRTTSSVRLEGATTSCSNH